MGFDPRRMLKFHNAWSQFTKNHPKLPKFIKAVSKDAVRPGTVIEVSVTTEEGKNYTANIKLTEKDMELFRKYQEKG